MTGLRGKAWLRDDGIRSFVDDRCKRCFEVLRALDLDRLNGDAGRPARFLDLLDEGNRERVGRVRDGGNAPHRGHNIADQFE